MGANTDALPPRMVRTCSGFWSWRLLHRRWPLRTRRPSAEHMSFWARNPDSRNAKPDHLVSQEATTALGRQQEQSAPNEPLVDQLGVVKGRQGRGVNLQPMAK
jgi:hypothetical protein